MSEPAPFSILDRPAQYLKGVGPKRAQALDRLGVRSARDLLFHVPRRYEDASTVASIGTLEVGMDATAIGAVVSSGVIPTRSGLRIFQAVLRDGTGMIECSWPGQPYLERTIRKGDRLLVTGPVRFFHGRQIQPREFVVLGREDDPSDDAGMVLPIYAATEGLSQRMLRSILDANLDRLLEDVEAEEVFRPDYLRQRGLPGLRDALDLLHRPPTVQEAEAGRRRLAYDELFFLQLLHARTRHELTERQGTTFRRSNELLRAAHETLPFALTDAQTQAIREIFSDMTSPRRMNRMLQGDVGSGKTVVALFAALLAAENGYQTALMAPTEILAEQHARTLRELTAPLPVDVTLLTGRLSKRERSDVLGSIATGTAQIVVGTHALIQEGVEFRRLGLVVVDEQHRFGVRQRKALAEQGIAPDVLAMSATPIPRSLALTLYGELDLSTLDEMPPGRQPIRTALREESARSAVYGFIREQVAAGRQAYIVYPLVSESDKVDLRAATEEFERLAGEVFAELRVGLIHGQLSGEDKDRVMRAFLAGDLDVLVATTVIEVGIDVPNAAVMVIEHAERFGLSQLHQLRGRVGRGADRSYCVLIASGGAEARERLRVMEETEDGFAIARADLRLRGMGELFGAKQHGLPEFRFFDAERDEPLLVQARQDARAVIEADPGLSRPEHERFRQVLTDRYGERQRLYETG